jgi:glutaredoxin 3
MNIIVYSKSNCPNCTTAKALLDSKGLDFIERSIDEPEWRDVFMRNYPEHRQMPQIFYKGERIGGLAGLREWLKWKQEQST